MKTFLAMLLLVPALPPAQAGDGHLRCEIQERTGVERGHYTIDVESKSNHTVYYYDFAHLVTRYYVRASGMVGGGAVFLQLNLEDTVSHVSASTKGVQSGFLRLGTNTEYVEMNCATTLDRR